MLTSKTMLKSTVLSLLNKFNFFFLSFFFLLSLSKYVFFSNNEENSDPGFNTEA